MEKTTKTTLASATILNLIFGVIFAILSLAVSGVIACCWLNAEESASDAVLAIIASSVFGFMFLPLFSYSSFNHFHAFSRKTTFILYELNMLDIVGVKDTLEAIQKDHAIMRQDPWVITFVKKEDFEAYCDWSLLHYRPKFATSEATE